MSDRDYVGTQAFTPDTYNGGSRQPQSTTIDMSQLKSEVKDPPMFRGDGTDKSTVSEWVDLMDTFLKKKESWSYRQSG